jgi:hypothetical protein
MTVYLTSFKRWNTPDVAEYLNADPNELVAYSIAVYQPSWFPQLPKLDLFDIRNSSGAWIRPRDFVGESHDATQPDPDLLKRYHDALLTLYRERWSDGDNTDILLREADAALCCWCPYDKAAKRQLTDYGSFICHTWPVETFLTELGIEAIRDEDRKQMVL